jgi:hypothetical protein
VIKPNYCQSSKSAVGLFLFSFFEPKSLLETSHRLAANLLLPNNHCGLFYSLTNQELKLEG